MSKITMHLVWIFLFFIFSFMLVGVGCSQMDELLPESIEGWKKCDSTFHYNRETLFDYIDGGAELYLAYDFKNLAVQKYCKDKSQITVEIYQSETSEDAFGLYSQNSSKRNIGFAQRGSYDSGELRFWKGRYFVRVYNWKDGYKLVDDILRTGRHIADEKIKKRGRRSAIFCVLPNQNVIPDSEHYFHKHISLNNHHFVSGQNIFNLSTRTNGFIADYKVKNDSLKYIFIQYPDSMQAKKAWRNFNQSYAQGKLNLHLDVAELENGEFVGAFLVNRYLGVVLQSDNKENTVLLNNKSEAE